MELRINYTLKKQPMSRGLLSKYSCRSCWVLSFLNSLIVSCSFQPSGWVFFLGQPYMVLLFLAHFFASRFGVPKASNTAISLANSALQFSTAFWAWDTASLFWHWNISATNLISVYCNIAFVCFAGRSQRRIQHRPSSWILDGRQNYSLGFSLDPVCCIV